MTFSRRNRKRMAILAINVKRFALQTVDATLAPFVMPFVFPKLIKDICEGRPGSRLIL